MWSIAPESIYQLVSTPYVEVAAEADFCGGPVKDQLNLLKQWYAGCPSFPQT